MPSKGDSDFDFDDWAGLYLENPREFEARRQAALMIELMRFSPQQAREGRQLLDSYEQAAEGRSADERLQMAAGLMQDSLHQLSAELRLLKQTLAPLVEATDGLPVDGQ